MRRAAGVRGQGAPRHGRIAARIALVAHVVQLRLAPASPPRRSYELPEGVASPLLPHAACPRSFLAEYAKSGRATCKEAKHCGGAMAKSELRIVEEMEVAGLHYNRKYHVRRRPGGSRGRCRESRGGPWKKPPPPDPGPPSDPPPAPAPQPHCFFVRHMPRAREWRISECPAAGSLRPGRAVPVGLGRRSGACAASAAALHTEPSAPSRPRPRPRGTAQPTSGSWTAWTS